MAVCSQIHTKHINTLCGQNVELLNVKLAVHIVTTGLRTVSNQSSAIYLHSQNTTSSTTSPQNPPVGRNMPVSVARSAHGDFSRRLNFTFSHIRRRVYVLLKR